MVETSEFAAQLEMMVLGFMGEVVEFVIEVGDVGATAAKPFSTAAEMLATVIANASIFVSISSFIRAQHTYPLSSGQLCLI